MPAVRVGELTGALLDSWVLICEAKHMGLTVRRVDDHWLGPHWVAEDEGGGNPLIFVAECDALKAMRFSSLYVGAARYAPSTNPAHSWPIIDREQIMVDPITRQREQSEWMAQVWVPYRMQRGGTSLVAAMRAYVASVYGDTVPDESDNNKEVGHVQG